MLRFLLGSARSGKTAALSARIGAGLRRSDRKALVLVPEQFSFETERALLLALGPQDMTRVEVLSFTRLCERIFHAHGGFAGNRLDTVGRRIVVDVALHECADQLEFYGRQIDYPAFQNELLLTLRGCKASLISPEILLRAAETQSASSPLRGKLHDLGIILATYNACVAQTAVDPLDDLARAAELLQGADFFARTDLYVDAFRDFSTAQQKLLAYALAECGDVTVALCADALRGTPLGLFSPTQRTAEQLTRLARRAGCKVAQPEILPAGSGFASPALRRLSVCLYQPQNDAAEDGNASNAAEAANAIRIVTAADRIRECERIAAEIRRMVRTEGFRYREIAVLAKNVDGVRELISNAFRKYGIPLFCDERMDILVSPPAVLLQSIIRAAGRLDTGAFLQIAKSGLLSVDEESLCELDDYCYTYNIAGTRWLSEFTGNPDGLAGEMDAEQAERLQRINALRERLVEPIETLRGQLDGADGYELTRELYATLEAYHARENLSALVEQLSAEDGRRRLLLESWNTLTDVLDRLCLMLADKPFSLERYASLLQSVLSEADYGLIPQTLDAVSLGAVDRARTTSPRAVFILGVEEGVFPAAPGDNGLFAQSERPRLEEAGLSLLDDTATLLCNERFLAYAAVTAATERIVFSYCTGSLRGDAVAPSELIREIRRVFPSLREEPPLAPDSGELVETAESAFSVYCAGRARQTGAYGALEPLLLENPEYAPLLRSLDNVSSAPTYRLENGGAALFAGQRQLSPSRVSAYYKCRFAYFCRYGMEVRPRPKAQITLLETGSLVHYVLERVVAECPDKTFCELSDGRLSALTERLVERFVKEQLGASELDERTRYQLERLRQMCILLVRRLADEFRQSEFAPVATELMLGRDEPGLRLRSPGGADVEVIGTIDRVDVMEKDGKKYLRVVDYKTGGKEFRLSDVREGLNMQMLLYLATLWKHGRGAFKNIIPAGVLYMTAQTAVQNGDASKLRMNGLLLDDPDALRGMEKDLKGVFIPVKELKKGGYSAESPLATLEQFGLLERLIERRVTQMADGLLAGDIAALPIEGELEHCKTCEYRSVCRREDDDPFYQPVELEKDKIWDAIAEEVTDPVQPE